MTDPVQSFVSTATEFCAFVESSNELTPTQFIHRARRLIPQLYLCGLSLPRLDPTELDSPREITHEEWDLTCRSLQQCLSKYDFYWKIFDPGELNVKDPVNTQLSDDLADIWRDLKNGLIHWESASEALRQQIVWEWRKTFDIHWSAHAVDALRVLDWTVSYYDLSDA